MTLPGPVLAAQNQGQRAHQSQRAQPGGHQGSSGWRARSQPSPQAQQNRGNASAGSNWRARSQQTQQARPRPPEAQRRQPQAQQRQPQAQQRPSQVQQRQWQQRQSQAQAQQRQWQGNQPANRVEQRTARPVNRAPNNRNNARTTRTDRQNDRRAEAIRNSNERRDRDRAYNRNDQTRDWQRNRSYRDNDRNRSYRSADWRNGQRVANSNNYRRWDRNWRNDNRYNWRDYRHVNRTLYRPVRYVSPYRDWSYRRLSVGFQLSSQFYGNRYWISDPWSYRLPAVYGPYRWIRYFDDVLLVDIYSGEVVDVIYDFFW